MIESLSHHRSSPVDTVWWFLYVELSHYCLMMCFLKQQDKFETEHKLCSKLRFNKLA